MAAETRVGIGYDVHPLVAGRRLVLGGVAVPFEKGLDGWSDADVLCHAVADAVLGAAGLGDIGQHFPPGDERFRGISSLVLLERVRTAAVAAGWSVVNIDATVVAEQPRLSAHFAGMKAGIAGALAVGPERVNIKATTSEGLGFAGRGEGIGAMAVALVTAG